MLAMPARLAIPARVARRERAGMTRMTGEGGDGRDKCRIKAVMYKRGGGWWKQSC
jgi:hypothetical protein